MKRKWKKPVITRKIDTKIWKTQGLAGFQNLGKGIIKNLKKS